MPVAPREDPDAARDHRRRLLDAMADAVAHKGYADTTIADLAARARVSRRTFYEHFDSKEACLIALYEAASGQALSVLRHAIDPAHDPLTQAEQALRAWGVRSTLVVFGSARATETGSPAQQRWYAEARAFGRIASLKGGALLNHHPVRDNVIATGGGPGIMEAANRGACDAGAPSIGFNITLPHEQEPNAYSTPELTFRFHYFAMRKMHLAMRASALVVFPGGFGTFDELFEILTLRQTRKSPPIPIVLFDEAYWRSVIRFEALVEHGMIAPADLDLFHFAETGEGVWDGLVQRGITARHLDPEMVSPG